ncbi:MAG TPA: response regulator transcription factor, partial [Geobacteraceae bacterium]
KILVIEDERRLAQLLKKGLEENHFAVDISGDGEEGKYMAENYPYDAMLLDIMLPKVDGLEILKSLRAGGNDVPVLIITARGEVEDRIKGLNIGADDYIAKPFDLAELIARLHSVIRRSKGKSSPMLLIDDLAIDTNARTVQRAGREISLSAREFALLEYLALNSGRVVSRTELTEHIYATDADGDSNVIDVYINYLRNKIDKGFNRPLIHTRRGAGYVLQGG